MQTLGALTLLIIAIISIVVVVVGLVQGRIWCLPRGYLEFKARWVDRSSEAISYWINTTLIGLFGVTGLVVATRMLFFR